MARSVAASLYSNSLNVASGVCLESIERFHYHQYEPTVAADDSDDQPAHIYFVHHCIRAGLGFTAVLEHSGKNRSERG